MTADNGDDHDSSAFDRDHVAPASAAAVNDEPSARWDAIAEAMWADYVVICCERENEGELDGDEELDSDEGSGHSGDESGSGNKGSGDDAWYIYCHILAAIIYTSVVRYKLRSVSKSYIPC